MKVGCYECGKTDVKLVERPKFIKTWMKNTVDVCVSCRNKWYKKHNLLLSRYNFTCPECSHEQSADTSIAMRMGYNGGHGSCMKCGVFLHLEIKDDMHGTEMKAVLWDDHLALRKDKLKRHT